MRGVWLSHLTWEEAVEAIKRYPIAVLPVGAGTKEHGPHLPLGTDLMVVQELARRVVESAPVMMLPPLAYGYFPAFIDWPGSVSVEPPNFTGTVGDIIRSLARHGIRKFLIIDYGFSTHPPLRTLSYQLHQELGVHVAVTNAMALGAEAAKTIAEQESGGHADELETSCMLVIQPGLVKMDRAVKEFSPSLRGTRAGKGVMPTIVMGGKMRTESGVNGDATLARPAKGETMLAAMTQEIVDFLNEFAAAVV
jgi:creatinine amidohydrolase